MASPPKGEKDGAPRESLAARYLRKQLLLSALKNINTTQLLGWLREINRESKLLSRRT